MSRFHTLSAQRSSASLSGRVDAAATRAEAAALLDRYLDAAVPTWALVHASDHAPKRS